MDDTLYFLYLFIIHQLQHSHAIHNESISVEMYSRGLDQSQTYGELPYVKIDGSANLIEPHTAGGGSWTYRGHNVVLINQINGQVLDSISFDTCACATSHDAVFSAYLAAISNDTIVAITTFDDGDDAPGAADILSSWGCSLRALGHREAFMFIGTANSRRTPPWQTCIISAQFDEPIHRLFDIPLTMQHPTTHPTDDPSTPPTTQPTPTPTVHPTVDPTTDPTSDPTTDPSSNPTINPSSDPTSDPSTEPTTALPTTAPTTKQPAAAVPSVAPSPSAEQQIHSFTTTLTATEAYNDALRASFVEKYKLFLYIVICVFMVLLLVVLFVLCKLSRAKIKNKKTASDSIHGYNVQRHSRRIQLSNLMSSSELSRTPPQPVGLQKVCSISMMQNDAINNMRVVNNELIDVVLDVMPNKNGALFVGTTPNGKELDEGMARIANVRKEGRDENDMQVFQDMECIQDTIGNIKNDEFIITDDDDIQTSK